MQAKNKKILNLRHDKYQIKLFFYYGRKYRVYEHYIEPISKIDFYIMCCSHVCKYEHVKYHVHFYKYICAYMHKCNIYICITKIFKY